MRPVRLEIENFLGVEKVELNFSPGVYVLIGRNGSGKSSIFEAILFSLYGQGIRFSRNVYDYVKYGRRNMRLRFVFERAGREYEVIREVSRDGKVGRHNAILLENDRPVARGPNEVKERITKIIGVGLDIFKGVFFIPQGRITSLVDSESEFRKIVMDILDIKRRKERLRETLRNMDRDLERSISSDVLKRTRKTIEELGGDPSELERKIEELRSERESLRSLKEDKYRELKALESVIEDLESVEKLRRDLEELRERIELDSRIREAKRIAPLLKEYDVLNSEVNELDGKLKGLRIRAERIEKSLKDHEKILEDLRKRRSDLEERSREISSRIDSLRGVLSRSAPLLKKLDSLKTSMRMREEDAENLEAESERLERVLEDSKVRLKSLEEDLEKVRDSLKRLEVEELDWIVWRIARNLEPGDRCPVCGSIVEDLTPKEVNAKFDPGVLERFRETERKLSTDIEVERERISNIERKIYEIEAKRRDIYEEISHLRKSIRETEAKLESMGYKPNLESEISDLESKLKGVLKAIEDVSRKESYIAERRASDLMEKKMLDSLISETITALESKKERFSEVSQRLYSNLEELSMSLEELREFAVMEEGGYIVEYERKKAVLESLLSKYTESELFNVDSMRSKRDSLAAEVRDLDRRIADISENLGRLEDRRSRLVEELEKLKELEERTEKASEDLKVVRFLMKILEAGRFDEFVFKRYLKIITSMANAHLVKVTRGRFELFLKDGSMFVRKEGLELPVGALSGGEKTLISLMLAMGISDAFVGNVGAMFIDEGFGALDEHNRIRVAGILKDLETLNRVIIFITHFEDLKDLFDRRLIMDGGVLKVG